MGPRSRVDESLVGSIMCGWSRGNSDDVFKERVVVRGKRVAAWVDVDRGFQGTNEDGLLNASFDPVLLRRKNGDVFFAEMVLVFARVLEHCRLIIA